MFSIGKIIFTIIFFIAFVIVIRLAYRKDKKLHLKYYKDTLPILLGIIGFILLLFVLKFFLSK
jgi:uncharacterized membrane protein